MLSIITANGSGSMSNGAPGASAYVLGQSGLAWHSVRGEAWLASSVIDLVTLVEEAAGWNTTYLADWLLGLASQPQTATAFEGVQRCRPGEIIVLSDGTVDRHQFDKLSADDAEVPLAPGVSRFRALVKRNLGSVDDRAALAMSGGLDSTAVALAWSSVRPGFHALT